MRISVYCTEDSGVALDMLKGYLRINDPALFETIEWSESEENSDKHLFFFASLADLDKEAGRIESIAAKSIPHLKVIMTQEKIKETDSTIKAWSVEDLHQFLLP